MEGLTQESVKDVLRRCDALYAEAKYEESLGLASAPELQKGPVDMLPYVLEMQIRNLMALLQFQSALKLLDEVLRYLPNLRDFLLRKVECEIALAKFDEASRSLSDMSKKMETEPTAEDSVWKERVSALKEKVARRKTPRDINKIRVRYADEEMSLDANSKPKKTYSYDQTATHVTVTFLVKTRQSPAEIQINMLPRQVTVGYETVDGKTFHQELDLFADILPKESTFDVKAGEVSLQLAKKEKNKEWDQVELINVPMEGPAKAGLTHTKRPWHEICTLF